MPKHERLSQARSDNLAAPLYVASTTCNFQTYIIPETSSAGDASPGSRRSLLENVSAALVAVAGAAAVASNPAPAAAKPQRIKGGGPVVTLEDGATYQASQRHQTEVGSFGVCSIGSDRERLLIL